MRTPHLIRSVVYGCLAAVTLVVGTASAQVTTLKIGYGGGQPDVGDVADYLGYQQLGSAYQVDRQSLGSDSAGVSALASGHLDIANVDLVSAIKAAQQGLPIRVLIAANAKQEFVFVAKDSIESLADLKGQRVAFHSIGSTTEYYAHLVVTKLAGLNMNDVKWLVIEGSNNRASALLANRIDATVLEWADWLELKKKGGFKILSTFNDVAPYAVATAYVTTQSWLDKHPQAAQDFVTAMAEGYRQAYSDKQAFMAEAAKLVPEVPTENVSGTYDFYTQIGMFPEADTFSPENWQKTDEYFRQVKEYSDPAPYDLVASDILSSAWTQ